MNTKSEQERLSKLTRPTIHLNGTSAEELFEQVCNVLRDLRSARAVMAAAAPHGRDYPINDYSFIHANSEHTDRLLRLGSIIREYEALAEHIADERDAREARRAPRYRIERLDGSIDGLGDEVVFASEDEAWGAAETAFGKDEASIESPEGVRSWLRVVTL